MVRIGMVGSGFMAETHLAAYRSIDGADVVAVAAPNTAEEFVAEAGLSAETYGSAEELMDEADVDARKVVGLGRAHRPARGGAGQHQHRRPATHAGPAARVAAPTRAPIRAHAAAHADARSTASAKTCIEEPVHAGLTGQNLAPGAIGPAPGGVDRRRLGIGVARAKCLDLLRILAAQDRTGRV